MYPFMKIAILTVQSASLMILFRPPLSPPPLGGGGGLPPLKRGGLLGDSLPPHSHSLLTRVCTMEAKSKLSFVCLHFILKDYK